MGRSITKKLFGDTGSTNIAVNFYKNADDGVVSGFIVEQTGTKRFVCSDGGTTRVVCYLVAKDAVDLNPGEMCITANWNSNNYQVSKIQSKLVTINGGQVPWSFNTTLNPGTAQLTDFGTAPVLYLGTNSYITFGEGSDNYSNLSVDNPLLPKIVVGGEDNSLQIMYYGVTGTAPNRVYVVRYQGTDDTSGDYQNPNMVIEYHFPEANKDQIEVHIVSNARGFGDYSGVATEDTELSAFPSVDAGDAYVWDDTAQTLTAITFNEYGTAGLTELDIYDNPSGEPPYDDWSEDDGFVGFFIPWTITFNGTNWG